jgi:HEAT repeat protein
LPIKPGPNTAQAVASQIHLEKYAQMVVQSVIHQYNGQPVPPATLNPQSLVSSLKSLYLSKKTLSIFRIKAKQKWEFKVPLEEIYVRLGIIENRERIRRDQALDKHFDLILDDRIPTFETIYEPKKNIEIEKLFEYESLEKKAAKRIYIQGAAGIGKSTLCHYIAYHWAKGELWQDIFSYLFWIPLRNLTLRKYPANEKHTPAALIAKEYEGIIDRQIIDACINDATFLEKTLLVLDGYDELSAEAQGNTSLATAFNELKKLFPHIIITSRPGSCSFKRSCELELLGFDKEGVDRYIDRFFKQVQAEEKKQKLYHLLQSSPQLSSLAQIPINLTLLCCLFNEDPEVFESNQSITMTAIYERIVNWMYKWFLLRRIDQGHSQQTKEKIFAEKNLRHNQEVENIATAFEEMADFALKKNTHYLEKREIDHFRGNAITSNELADCGLIRIPEEKGYFIHPTFQEFLTASKIANQYLQGENRQACQNFVRNYKFEPRYTLVLRMIAGYLSLCITNNRLYLDLNPNPLQFFFDDLFAEPQDLSVRSELNLIANCFEECQNPAHVRQYEGFIELVKGYMIDLCLLGLDFEQLIRNKNLLNHPKVTSSIEELLSNPKTVENMLSILLSIIRTGQRLAPQIVGFITGVLKRPAGDSVAKSYAVSALRTVAEQGGDFPKEAVDALIQILTKGNNEGDPDAKMYAADTLSIVAKCGGKLPKEAVDALIQILQEVGRDATCAAADVLAIMAQQEDEIANAALDALIQVLKEGDPNVTCAAAATLGTVAKYGGKLSKEALETLSQMLQEGDPNVTCAAAAALGAVAEQGGKLSKEAVYALIQALKKGDPNVTCAAAAALGTVAQQGSKLPKEAVDALIQILQEGDPNITCAAVVALGTVSLQGSKLPKEAVDALIKMLLEGDRDAKKDPADALAIMAQQGGEIASAALEALIQVLKEGDPNATCAAAAALRTVAKYAGKLPKEALEALIQILQEGGRDATCAAAAALGTVAQYGGKLPKEALDALIQILQEGGRDATCAAAAALGTVAQQGSKLPKEALVALSQMLQEGDRDAKRDPADALAIMAQQGGEFAKEAVDALIQIFQEGDPNAKWFAANALGTVAQQGGEIANAALDALIQVLKKGDPNVTCAAAAALGTVAQQGNKLPKEAVDALIQALKKGDPNVTCAAAAALGTAARQGSKLPKEAVDALIQILQEGGRGAKRSAAIALGTMALQGSKLPKEAQVALIQALKEARGYVRDTLKAVAQQGDEIAKEAVDALIQILKKGDPHAKMYAADTLSIVAKYGGKLPKEVLDALVQILKEGDPDAKMYAADTLSIVVKYAGKLPKEAVDALIQALKKGDPNVICAAAAALGTVAQQGNKLPKEALDALIQILQEGDPEGKRSAAIVLKKVDRNALLEMGIEAFPLIAKVCFFTMDSLSIKSHQLQISGKTTIYPCKDKLMLHYKEIRKQLPKELAVWRKRLDRLSQTGSS